MKWDVRARRSPKKRGKFHNSPKGHLLFWGQQWTSRYFLINKKWKDNITRYLYGKHNRQIPTRSFKYMRQQHLAIRFSSVVLLWVAKFHVHRLRHWYFSSITSTNYTRTRVDTQMIGTKKNTFQLELKNRFTALEEHEPTLAIVTVSCPTTSENCQRRCESTRFTLWR